MDAGDLKGLAVVSLDEGTKLGTVEHPLFDLSAHKLRAVEVHGSSGAFVIPFGQIASIGDDALVVTSSEMTQTSSTSSSLGAMLNLAQIGKLKIVDDTGTFLGTVNTIDFDTASGRIRRMAVHKGGMLGIGGSTTELDPSDIIGVGHDIVTVKSTSPGDDPATSSS